jgi:hypothetical protein
MPFIIIALCPDFFPSFSIVSEFGKASNEGEGILHNSLSLILPCFVPVQELIAPQYSNILT